MVELIIQEGTQELLRCPLAEGSHRLGRTSDNQITLASSHLSRQHLQIQITATGITVTDLGSTNGTMLRGRKLTPHAATPWPEQESLQIGPLTLTLHTTTPSPAPTATAAAPVAPPETPATQLVAHITCREAQPSTFTLESGFATVGSGIRADIRPMTANVEAEHCRLTLHQNQLRVINLSRDNPVKLSGVPVPLNQPTPWPKTQALEVGYARLYYTVAQATVAAAPQTRAGAGRWLAVAASMGGILTICIIVTALIMLGGNSNGGGEGNSNVADNNQTTPTLAPRVSITPSPRIPSTLDIPTATITTVEGGSSDDGCAVAAAAQEGGGWLELPFPYEGIEANFADGSAEQFRLISQRSRSGGRINSFFDHQFPVYPPAFGGQETDDAIASMLLFDGSLSFDAYSQDDSTSGSDARFDYYSGHAGIDFAPASVGNPREPQTPVFAAADGFLHTATIDTDGNHMVWLSHDRGADGIYATLYFHLADDEYFQAMLAMEEGTEIPAGTRLGTMGTTGRSTGIHLHFEVRKDINRDRLFTTHEKIDPYGYFPSEEFPIDPWSQPWIDRTNKEYDGISSEYLWKYPLVDIEDEQDARCQPDHRPHLHQAVQPLLYLSERRRRSLVLAASGSPPASLVLLPASCSCRPSSCFVSFNSFQCPLVLRAPALLSDTATCYISETCSLPPVLWQVSSAADRFAVLTTNISPAGGGNSPNARSNSSFRRRSGTDQSTLGKTPLSRCCSWPVRQYSRYCRPLARIRLRPSVPRSTSTNQTSCCRPTLSSTPRSGRRLRLAPCDPR